MKVSLWFYPIVFVLASTTALSATVTELHSARVPVTDSSDTEFARGLEAAFEVVLIKLTGSSASAKAKGLRQLAARAPQFNTAFGFENVADGTLRLRADFDLPAASNALRERGFWVWGRERPEVLTWLIVIDSSGRHLGPSESNRAIFDALSTQAARRAIPLRRAIADSTVRSVVANASSDEEIVTGLTMATPPTAQAATLIGIIRQAEGQRWQGLWQLALDRSEPDSDTVTQWNNEGAFPEPLATEGIDRMVDAVAQHFATLARAGGDRNVRLTVLGVGSAEDYGRVLNYLSSLEAVAKIKVSRVVDRQVEFDLTTHDGLASLSQVIALGRQLTPLPDNATTYQLNSR